MSVIIRLQNLPWSANAGDIRTYFSGLSIPEGGVHIIGGEQGDAFIAFSTDEDARQAMQKDNGKLKEVQIKLFLSSRTEMLRVIEQARQEALKIHNLMNVPSAPATAAPAAPKVDTKVDGGKDDDDDKRRRDRSTSRTKGKDDRRSRSRRDRDRRRRDRSGSRSRSRDRSRDRYSRSRRSRSRDRRRSRDRDSKEPRNKNNRDSNKEDQKKLPDPPAIPTQLLQMHQNGKESSPTNTPFGEDKKFPFPNQISPFMPPFPQIQQIRPMPMPPLMDPSIMQRALMQNPEMIQNYNFPMVPPVFQPPNIDPSFVDPWKMNMNQGNNGNTNLCIEIRGLPLNASYIDVKKLFDGLSIPSDGIKMINDTHGYRTGIAYVKFSNSNHKKLALNQNGKKVRSNTVEVIDLRDGIYQSAVDNFKPDKDVSFNSVDMDIENEEDKAYKHNDHKKLDFRNNDFKTSWVMLRGLPSGSNERDVFDFFSSHSLSPLQVFFVVNHFGYSDAYARFLSPDDADKAILISNPAYNRTPFTITKTTQEEADRLNPAFSDNQRLSRPTLPSSNPSDNRRPWRNDFNNDKFNRQDGRFRRNDFYDRGRGRGRGRGRFMGNGSRMEPRAREPSPSYGGDNNILENFSQRGTIVSLENIHFKADLEEILEFFEGFDLEQEHILRRFDDLGRPTGDARVALKSLDDAMRAVKELNYKPIRGRTIRLQLLQN